MVVVGWTYAVGVVVGGVPAVVGQPACAVGPSGIVQVEAEGTAADVEVVAVGMEARSPPWSSRLPCLRRPVGCGPGAMARGPRGWVEVDVTATASVAAEAWAGCLRGAVAVVAGQADVEGVWHTAADERVRPSHQYMHLQRRPLGEPFLSGDGNLLEYPGDRRAPAEDVIRCRCVVARELKPEARM